MKKGFPCLQGPADAGERVGMVEGKGKIDKGRKELMVAYNHNNPPHILFDTNVWRDMNKDDVVNMKSLQNKRGFIYRYSVTNFIELASRLSDNSSDKCHDSFSVFRSCFGRIQALCNEEILPSPEFEFAKTIGLEKFIDPIWIPDTKQFTLMVKLIAEANEISELAGVIDIDHYKKLKETDRESIQKLMKELNRYSRPITLKDSENLIKWFLKLAFFFLLERPSKGELRFNHLTNEEQDQFYKGFTFGGGRLFHIHAVSRVKKIVNDKKNIDPNDLYDMLQLIMLGEDNRLFITNDRAFFYKVDNHLSGRILPWKLFRKSC